MKYPRGLRENIKQSYNKVATIYADAGLFNKEVCEKTGVGFVFCRESNEAVGDCRLIFYSQKRQYP